MVSNLKILDLSSVVWFSGPFDVTSGRGNMADGSRDTRIIVIFSVPYDVISVTAQCRRNRLRNVL